MAPPVVNAPAPEITVTPPEVVVNIEAPQPQGPRSVRVEEDEEGNRIYRVLEED